MSIRFINPETILFKGTKIVHIKASKRAKAHTRKVKSEKEISKINLRDGINNMNLITKDDKVIEEILEDGDWNLEESTFFHSAPPCRNVLIHAEKSKIYAMSKLLPIGNSVHISLLEVNSSKQRQGYGIKAMKDIINTIIKSEIYNKIELTSVDKNSDKFYGAIGMERINSKENYKYEGDKQWMKEFIKLI